MEYEKPCVSFRATLLPNECPGLCRHRPGHLLGKNKNKVARNEERKKNYLVFLMIKIWQILKDFARSFHQA